MHLILHAVKKKVFYKNAIDADVFYTKQKMSFSPQLSWTPKIHMKVALWPYIENRSVVSRYFARVLN